jgi:hypothetical protein
MTKITLDAELARKLLELKRQVEETSPRGAKLVDPSGKVLGEFNPELDMTEWEPLTPEITEEELDRREKANEQRYTTAEVLAHLNSLEKR